MRLVDALLWILVLILVLIIAAVYIAHRGRNHAAADTPNTVVGGSNAPHCSGNAPHCSGGARHCSGGAGPEGHALGHAMYRYAMEHAEGDGLDLPSDGSDGSAAVEGGAAAVEGGSASSAWTTFKSWRELNKNKVALQAYTHARNRALNNPAFDWRHVMDVIGPLLREKREYIGLINVEPDGRTLKLGDFEASPEGVGESGNPLVFASIPSELVEKYSSRPALFLFHTHPDDPRAGPFPSSHDLSTALHYATRAQFAASVVISRYGPLVYGLDHEGYRAVQSARDWKLAALNLSHDVVAAHEAVRSWSEHSIAEYMAFYARHQMFLFSYPTPELVGDMRRLRLLQTVEHPIDYDLLDEHRSVIEDHTARHRGARRAATTTVQRENTIIRPWAGTKADVHTDDTEDAPEPIIN